MNFEAFQTADRRLVILRALKAAAEYRANTLLLRTYCDTVGHTVSADRIAGDVAWLAEQELVKASQSGGIGGITVAQLTERGLDVADGRTQVPGVARPRPGF